MVLSRLESKLMLLIIITFLSSLHALEDTCPPDFPIESLPEATLKQVPCSSILFDENEITLDQTNLGKIIELQGYGKILHWGDGSQAVEWISYNVIKFFIRF